jgi:hypothetical protein
MESQKITVCQDIEDSTDGGFRTDAIIIDFSKAFSLLPHDSVLTQIAATGVDVRVVVWVKEFLFGRSQRVWLDGKISDQTTVNSGVQQGS